MIKGSLGEELPWYGHSRADKNWEETQGAEKSWEELSKTSWAELRRAKNSRAELRRAEQSREEVRRADQSWEELRRAEESWAELRRAEESWEELRRRSWEGLRSAEKSCSQLQFAGYEGCLLWKLRLLMPACSFEGSLARKLRFHNANLQFLTDILHEMFLWEIAVAYVSSILETTAIGFLLYQQANIRIIRSDWSCRLWWSSHFITVCCWKFQLYKSKHMIQGPSTSSHTVCVWNFERRAWWGFIHALVSLEFALRLGDLPSAQAQWPGRIILRSRLTHSFLREEQHHRSRAPW